MPTRLVVVACHAVFAGGCAVGAYPDEAPYYLEHARAGVELAESPDALLIFSGGATQMAAGLRTEGESYLEEAWNHNWWGHPEVAARAATEDYARDSRENLLFSLHRFRACTGLPPEHITIVGWRFKQRRFHLHIASIGWPEERFRYAGVNDPPSPSLEAALASEEQTLLAVLADPHLEGPTFAAKRTRRNPFSRVPPYPAML